MIAISNSYMQNANDIAISSTVEYLRFSVTGFTVPSSPLEMNKQGSIPARGCEDDLNGLHLGYHNLGASGS